MNYFPILVFGILSSLLGAMESKEAEESYEIGSQAVKNSGQQKDSLFKHRLLIHSNIPYYLYLSFFDDRGNLVATGQDLNDMLEKFFAGIDDPKVFFIAEPAKSKNIPSGTSERSSNELPFDIYSSDFSRITRLIEQGISFFSYGKQVDLSLYLIKLFSPKDLTFLSKQLCEYIRLGNRLDVGALIKPFLDKLNRGIKLSDDETEQLGTLFVISYGHIDQIEGGLETKKRLGELLELFMASSSPIHRSCETLQKAFLISCFYGLKDYACTFLANSKEVTVSFRIFGIRLLSRTYPAPPHSSWHEIAGKGLIFLIGRCRLFQSVGSKKLNEVRGLCSLILNEFGRDIPLPQLLMALELALAGVYQPKLARTIFNLIMRRVAEKEKEGEDDKEQVNLTAALILAALHGHSNQLELFYYFLEKVIEAGLPWSEVYLLITLLVKENPKKFPWLEEELERVRRKPRETFDNPTLELCPEEDSLV